MLFQDFPYFPDNQPEMYSRVRTQSSEVDNQLAKHCKLTIYKGASTTRARDRHIMLFLEPIILCSSSQFCSHYAHATIPIMPTLCSNLKDSPHVFRNLLGIWYKSKLSFHCIFVVLSDFYCIYIYLSIAVSMTRCLESLLVYMSWSFHLVCLHNAYCFERPIAGIMCLSLMRVWFYNNGGLASFVCIVTTS